MRKAELSLTVVIGAAIALLVLVILSFILFGGASNVRSGLSSCDGMCVADRADCDADPRYNLVVPMNNCNDGQSHDSRFRYCCTSV